MDPVALIWIKARQKLGTISGQRKAAGPAKWAAATVTRPSPNRGLADAESTCHRQNSVVPLSCVLEHERASAAN